MYFHCQTTLVDTLKEMYRGQFEFGGNRSINLSVEDKVPVEELSHCIQWHSHTISTKGKVAVVLKANT